MSTTTETVTFETVLDALYPIASYIRLVATASDAERFFFRSPSHWMSMSGSPSETFKNFTTAFNNRECFFSPVAWTAPQVGSAPAPLTALFARLPLALVGPRPHHPAPDVDPTSAATMRAKLINAIVPPSCVLDEGDAITGIWKLTTALADMVTARRLLVQIAWRLDGDRNMSDLATALVRVPGSRNTSIYPARDVRVETFEPERAYDVAEIENWLSASRGLA